MKCKNYIPTICTSVLTPLLSSCTDSKQEVHKPNIIYILADDLGYAELGCFGQEKIETPNIDRLSAEGMRFTNHYSGQAVSGPSRCVLMTGLHTGHAYIRGNDEVASRGDVWSHEAMLADSSLEGQRPVPASTIMIPRKLKEAGYTTACIGKWGLGFPGSASMGITASVRLIPIILLSFIATRIVNTWKTNFWFLAPNWMKELTPIAKGAMLNMYRSNMLPT